MGQITLVCTAHSEGGRFNHQELLKILLTLSPEVIFEEVRPEDFRARYAHETSYTLEMRAIKKYVEGKIVTQVPVDEYVLPHGFVRYMGELDGFVASRSQAYSTLMDRIFDKRGELGFRYLNSMQYVEEMRESDRLFEQTVIDFGDDVAKGRVAEWNELILKRGQIMLENIYRFCRQTEFSEAVFVVGAGHLASMREGIEQRMKDEPGLVSWRFWNGP